MNVRNEDPKRIRVSQIDAHNSKSDDGEVISYNALASLLFHILSFTRNFKKAYATIVRK